MLSHKIYVCNKKLDIILYFSWIWELRLCNISLYARASYHIQWSYPFIESKEKFSLFFNLILNWPMVNETYKYQLRCQNTSKIKILCPSKRQVSYNHKLLHNNNDFWNAFVPVLLCDSSQPQHIKGPTIKREKKTKNLFRVLLFDKINYDFRTKNLTHPKWCNFLIEMNPHKNIPIFFFIR